MNLPVQQHQRTLLVLPQEGKEKEVKMCNQTMIIKILPTRPPIQIAVVMPIEEKGVRALAKGYLENKILPLENEDQLQPQQEKLLRQ